MDLTTATRHLFGWRLAAAGVLAMSLAGMERRAGAQEFRYRLSAPDAIRLNEVFDVAAQLVSSKIPAGEPGAEGWQIAVGHRNLEILSVTTAGTVVDAYPAPIFNSTEITAGAGNAGFVSAVALSLGEAARFLPPDGTVAVARARYRVLDAACREGAAITLQDGLQGSGLPVRNRVFWNNAGFSPAADSRTFTGCVPDRYRLSLDLPSGPVPLRIGEPNRFSARVALEQEVPAASGWSLAVAHDPQALTIVGVTIDGTGVGDHIAPDGFALFEVTAGPANSGFVSRVELSAASPRLLPGGRRHIAWARYQPAAAAVPIGEVIRTTLRFAESLRGSGVPIANQVFPPGILELEAPRTIEFLVMPAGAFIRGDANGSGSLDISDPVAALLHLFSGLDGICAEAANSNGDSVLDISDPVHLLRFIFLGGPKPPQPYPACGKVEGGLGCAVTGCP